MDASFWNSYFPPNGWNCHCRVVRVPKGDKPHSNNAAAIAQGEKATTTLDKNGKNSAAIFRYNPGKQQIIFPEKHPYYPQHCNGEKLNLSGWMELGKWLLDAEGDRCKAKKIVEEHFQAQKKERKSKNLELINWSHGIIKKGHHLTFTGSQFASEVRVSRSNLESIIKHIADPENKEIVKSIEEVVTGSKFIKQAKLGEGVEKSSKNIGRKKARGVIHYRYYKAVWNGINVEINMEVMKDGYEQPYSIDFI